MSMTLYEDGDADGAVRCAHCRGSNTAPTVSRFLTPLEKIDHKDSVWGRPCGYLECEGCVGFTAVYLMFHKGNTFIHTIAVKGKRA